MTEGEASCAAQWAAFVQQNISTPAVANVTAGEFLARCTENHHMHAQPG